LDLFVAVLSDSMDRIIKEESHILSQNDLEKNFFLANSTLGTLEDFVMLLNTAGQVYIYIYMYIHIYINTYIHICIYDVAEYGRTGMS
jgi:hypothetical protein